MKLVSLNIWGGKAYKPLLEFLKKTAPTTDVFCFQEVFSSESGVEESNGSRVNILKDLRELFSDFNYYYSPDQDRFDNSGPVDLKVILGKAIFLRKNLTADSHGNFFVYGMRDSAKGLWAEDLWTVPASAQFIRLRPDGKQKVRPLTICNFHGMAAPGDKLDTPERLAQSGKIKKFLEDEAGAKILCGDFNLLPETKSITMLEKNLINLIKKFNIESTRSRLSPFFGKPGFQKFADYVFVSSDIDVKKFEVSDAAVSDHLPMILEFELRV